MTVTELVAVLGLDVDEQAFRKADALIAGARMGLLGIASAFVGAAAGIGAMIASTGEAAKRIEETSQRAGVNTKALQELAYAGQYSGVQLEDMAHALGFMSRTMYDATTGSSEARQAFSKLGVQITDSAGKLRDPQAVFEDIADKLSKMPDGALKSALAMKVFSRGGAQMIPFLNQGRDGIRAMAAEAESLGVVMDEATIKQGSAYRDSVTRLGAAFEGLRNEIGGPLLKGAADFLDELTKIVRENRKAIAGVIVSAWKKMGTVLHAAGEGAKFLFHHLWILRGLLGWYATFLLVRMIPQLLALTAAEVSWGLAALIAGARAAAAGVMAAAAGAAAMLPWLLLAAVLYLVADDMYYFFTGGDSLIGRYGAKWTAFLDGLLKERADDNWLEAWFKAVLRAITDVQGAWDKFRASLSLKGVVNGDLQRTDAYALLDPAGYIGTRIGDSAGANFDPLSMMFGGGASPSAQVANSPSFSGPSNSVGDINVSVTVPPGTSPEDTGKAVADQVHEILQGHFNAAAAVEGP